MVSHRSPALETVRWMDRRLYVCCHRQELLVPQDTSVYLLEAAYRIICTLITVDRQQCARLRALLLSLHRRFSAIPSCLSLFTVVPYAICLGSSTLLRVWRQVAHCAVAHYGYYAPLHRARCSLCSCTSAMHAAMRALQCPMPSRTI